MYFDLEPGKTFCDGVSKPVTVKINNEERLNLPFTYYLFDKGSLVMHNFMRYPVRSILDNPSQKLELKLEKVKDDYRLALVNGLGQYYYYYYSDPRILKIATLDSIPDNLIVYLPEKHFLSYNDSKCLVGYIPLMDSKVLIDPQDIMSSRDINLILKDLENSPDKRLKIKVGEEFLKLFDYKSVELYNSSNYKVGILNSIAAIFSYSNLKLLSGSSIIGLGHDIDSYFQIERLNNNYFGYILSKYNKYDKSYGLTPEEFNRLEDKCPDDNYLYYYLNYPYYYYLHGLEISMTHKEIEKLKREIEGLKNAGIKGEKGEPGFSGKEGCPGPKGEKGDSGPTGPKGKKGDPGVSGSVGPTGAQGLKGEQGPPGETGKESLPGTPGLTGEKGSKGDIGLPGRDGKDGSPGSIGDLGPKGERGDKGAQGLPGQKGDKGPQGLKGDAGLPGTPGERGMRGFKGNTGRSGPIGLNGRQGDPGPKGDKGDQGLQGLKGKDGVGAEVADQFLRKINQTEIEIQDAQEAAEAARNSSESFAKEAQNAERNVAKLHDKTVNLTERAKTLSDTAKQFSEQALASQRSTDALHSQVKDIFCKTKPTDQVCTPPRRKRETKNLNNRPVTSGASRPTPFISRVINFFYPSVKQDGYRIENKIQEPNQVIKIVDAADIVIKFEKILEETASRCGIPKKSLNFNPVGLQSIIVSKSLFNDENHNELLKLLYSFAKEACSSYKQTDKFLAIFKDRMERTLANNEQQRGFIDIEKMATDNEQPRSFMNDILPPSGLSAINQRVIGYLR